VIRSCLVNEGRDESDEVRSQSEETLVLICLLSVTIGQQDAALMLCACCAAGLVQKRIASAEALLILQRKGGS
jgi:hypothetical protein